MKYLDKIYKNNSANPKHKLDIFTPEAEGKYPVVIFIHGGSWYNGCKEWYHPLGENFAQLNIVSVIINYRLGKEADFEQMASDCAYSLKWVYENIEKYKGDENKIFLFGHSAGGHLSALAALDPMYLHHAGITCKIIKGCILLDAFGLNMDYVMMNNKSFFVKELERVFSKDPERWKKAAPVNFITDRVNIPFYIFIGAETYPYIKMDNMVFLMNLEDKKVPFSYSEIKGLNHVQMITSMENSKHFLYENIINFIHDPLSIASVKTGNSF